MNPEDMHSYGIDRAYEEWQEDVFKKKNPGSETEAGVDVDLVWKTVLDAMEFCYWQGYKKGEGHNAVDNPNFPNILRQHIKRVIDDDGA